MLLILFWLPLHAHAQVFDFETDRVQIAELHGLARFHIGDNPRWADPAFDDSQWQLVRMDQSWYQQGYNGYTGFAWYRFKVVLPRNHSSLALYVQNVWSSYQVFACGRLIGQFGGLPPSEKLLDRTDGIDEVHGIPAELAADDGSVQIAIRVWHPAVGSFLPGGPTLPLILGDERSLEAQRHLKMSENLRFVSGWNFLMLGYLLAALAGLGLFLLRKSDYEYLWFAGAELGNALLCLSNILTASAPIEIRAHWSSALLARLVIDVCWTTFIVSLLKQRKGPLYWATLTFVIAGRGLSIFLLIEMINARQLLMSFYLPDIPIMICTLLLLGLPARRGLLDARLLLAPQILYYAAKLIGGAIFIFGASGYDYALYTRWIRHYQTFITWPVTASFENCADFICQVAVLAILILRFARSRRDEERLKSEFEAARLVQQLLVAAEVSSTGTFRIESRFLPAGQVGGDFFQVIPDSEGGVLIVIGDVSGKGMPAAMTVSLLVGTVRTLAHYTDSPGEILSAMNRRMLTRSNGGFTTCLALRVEPDGAMKIANAGHIAPILNGAELEIQNGLPLGLTGDSVYEEAAFSLIVGDQLTLVTDGVVEARSKDGE
ncbi:MAG TPA: PP2C family protein-serine/threonine phosphatase, partial [Nitrospira sp.]|nr:PP2C family protein-serine/threonine phosphatase [Nitrospira sp.]